jgi:hypothetical protein
MAKNGNSDGSSEKDGKNGKGDPCKSFTDSPFIKVQKETNQHPRANASKSP